MKDLLSAVKTEEINTEGNIYIKIEDGFKYITTDETSSPAPKFYLNEKLTFKDSFSVKYTLQGKYYLDFFIKFLHSDVFYGFYFGHWSNTKSGFIEWKPQIDPIRHYISMKVTEDDPHNFTVTYKNKTIYWYLNKNRLGSWHVNIEPNSNALNLGFGTWNGKVKLIELKFFADSTVFPEEDINKKKFIDYVIDSIVPILILLFIIVIGKAYVEEKTNLLTILVAIVVLLIDIFMRDWLKEKFDIFRYKRSK